MRAANGNAHAAVAVDTTTAGGEIIVAARSGRTGLIVQNLSATVDVYIGGAAVTVANGLKLAAGASVSLGDYLGSLHGVVAAGSADVRYLETV